MKFYELCRSIRNKYRTEPNKEIELQILTQLYSAVFSNDDKMPTELKINLDLKSVLKSRDIPPMWKAVWKELDYDLETRTKYLVEAIISRKLSDTMDLFGMEYWSLHSFRRISAWEYSAEIGVSPRYKDLP